MILFRNVFLSRRNRQPVLGGNRFFRRKVTIFIGRETKPHILPTKINENKSLRSALLSIIILFEFGRFVMSPMYLALPVRCLRWCNAWFDCGHMFCLSRVASGRIFDFPRDWVDSDTEVSSRRLSPCEHGRRSSCARRRQRPWHAFCWFYWYFCTSRCIHDDAGMTACTR